MSKETISAAGAQCKLLSFGRVWVNDRENENGTSPKMTLKVDQNLGINIEMAANDTIVFFPNTQRKGINPKTEKEFQDPDFRAAISLPADAVNKEIARQLAAANNQATSHTNTPEAVEAEAEKQMPH